MNSAVVIFLVAAVGLAAGSWWQGRTSLGRPVIGVTRDGRPITDYHELHRQNLPSHDNGQESYYGRMNGGHRAQDPHLFNRQHHQPTHTRQHYQPTHTRQHHQPTHTRQHHQPTHIRQHHQPTHTRQHHQPTHTRQHYQPTHTRQHHQPTHIRQHHQPTHTRQHHQPTHIRQHHQQTHTRQHYQPTHTRQHHQPTHTRQHYQPTHTRQHHQPTHTRQQSYYGRTSRGHPVSQHFNRQQFHSTHTRQQVFNGRTSRGHPVPNRNQIFRQSVRRRPFGFSYSRSSSSDDSYYPNGYGSDSYSDSRSSEEHRYVGQQYGYSRKRGYPTSGFRRRGSRSSYSSGSDEQGYDG